MIVALLLVSCYSCGMVNGPNIARIAALIGDQARARMLGALMAGQAMTARELAEEAGIAPQTASSHLAKLVDGELISVIPQGRHRYFRIADAETAYLLESLSHFTEGKSCSRVRFGPNSSKMRVARICYDHLAGSMGVQIYDALWRMGALVGDEGQIRFGKNTDIYRELGIDLRMVEAAKRANCRSCLDWSERRYHLAGGLGAAMLTHFLERNWLYRGQEKRCLHFTPEGVRKLHTHFGIGI